MKASNSQKKAVSKSGHFKWSYWRVWLIAAFAVLILVVAAARMPRFPLDLSVAQGVQRINSLGYSWAKSLTDTAKPPVAYGLLLVASLIGWRLAGLRAAFLAPTAYAVVLGLDRILKPWIARPRPSSDLIHVVGAYSGFGCPSTFGLIYAATVGTVAWLALRNSTGRTQGLVAGTSLLVLVLGGSARVVLGGHWPSDLLLSYLLGGLVVSALAKPLLGK